MCYAVIILDTEANDTEICATFEEKRDAIEYMTELVNKDPQYDDEKWFRKIIGEDTISIYECGWFFRKTLIFRYYIKFFD